MSTPTSSVALPRRRRAVTPDPRTGTIYRHENWRPPIVWAAVPGENLLACARIAVLHLMATPPRSASLAAWETRTTAVHRLLRQLSSLDEAVRTIARLRSHPV
ncbi:hypothetical protein [Streptomyces sp. NPDC007172]|uniref:hypothetical protein n=1 Tax=Streptomyces sp. NPDC007172 TaxID=3364776 RepID=UPI00368E6AF7